MAAARGEGALPAGPIEVHATYIQLLNTHACKQAAIVQADVLRETNALLAILAGNAAPELYDALLAKPQQ